MQNIAQKTIELMLMWLSGHGAKIAVILIAAFAARRFGVVFIEKVVRRLAIADHFLTKQAEVKRENTLISVFGGTLRVAIWLVTGMMVTAELGVNIGPLLAAAGGAGRAFLFFLP